MKHSLPIPITGVALVCLLGSSAVRARAASPVEFFDGARAWQVDSVLASPSFGGQRSGTPGAAAAEKWIASRFVEADLRPAAEGGGYLQGFPVIGYEPKAASLELLDGPFGRIRFVHGDDFTLLLTPAGGTVTAEAVFVGYGIDAPAKGLCDYDLTSRTREGTNDERPEQDVRFTEGQRAG
jgi:hypothetical protein